MAEVEIEIITRSERVERVLGMHAGAIGRDLDAYRNHVLRTLTYALHILGPATPHRELVETALAYHDIGLWTDRATAYLVPSEELAVQDAEREGWGLDPEALRGCIHWHHKVSRYRGPHAAPVEACRRADWIDVTKGRMRKGLSRADVDAVQNALPNAGFHKALVRLARENGGSTVRGLLRVTRGIVRL